MIANGEAVRAWATEVSKSDVDSHFDGVMDARRSWLELAGGERVELPVSRWRGAVTACDELLLGPC
ncbi:MAG: hypothetical protein ACRDQF_17435, partial [Thermocrispum sp.]